MGPCACPSGGTSDDCAAGADLPAANRHDSTTVFRTLLNGLARVGRIRNAEIEDLPVRADDVEKISVSAFHGVFANSILMGNYKDAPNPRAADCVRASAPSGIDLRSVNNIRHGSSLAPVVVEWPSSGA
jgi:hypothetical protein